MRHLCLAVLSLFSTVANAEEMPWRAKAMDEIRAEPKVIDAMFNGGSSLWISVLDDGSRRDGLASYFCTLLHQAEMPNGGFYVIHIWDALKMAADEMVELGRNDCSKS